MNYMSHNASCFVTCSLKRLAIIRPTLLLSDVVNYEVITLSDNNPMQRQLCIIIHIFISSESHNRPFECNHTSDVARDEIEKHFGQLQGKNICYISIELI